MQLLIPPGQDLDTACMTLSRAEARGLRTALDLMLSTGSSARAQIAWGDHQADVTVILATDTGPPSLPDEPTGGLP